MSPKMPFCLHKQPVEAHDQKTCLRPITGNGEDTSTPSKQAKINLDWVCAAVTQAEISFAEYFRFPSSASDVNT